MKKITSFLILPILLASISGCNRVPGARSSEILNFKETTVADNENCEITIQSIDPNGSLGYTLNAHLENKSPDKTYTFTIDDAYINGVYCDPIFASELEAGKNADVDITFPTETLEEHDLEAVTDMEMYFSVYDRNDIDAQPIFQDAVHIYPYGKKSASVFVRETEAEDQILLDNHYVTVILTDYEDNDIWGYTADLYLINKSNYHLLISANDVYINNCACEPYFAKTLRAEKAAFTKMTWSKSELEEYDLTFDDINKIEFRLKISDFSEPSTPAFVDETIILRP